MLTGCSGEHQESGQRQPEPPKTPSSGTVEFPAEVQQMLHLKIEALTAASAPRETAGYGRVLDPAPLAAAVSEWSAARAAALASGQELERTKILRKQSTASERTLQTVESAAARDRLLADSIRDRISLSWGGAVARRTDLSELLRALVARERVIVRVDLPAGGPVQPQRAKLAALDQAQTVEAQLLGRAPAADPRLQGQGFLFLTRDNSLDLVPGAAVTASLEFADLQRGVLLPTSAVVRYEAQLWVYLQKTPTAFSRTPVSLGPSLPDGWLVTQELRTADRVVTQGAQALLSEELKPLISLPD